MPRHAEAEVASTAAAAPPSSPSQAGETRTLERSQEEGQLLLEIADRAVEESRKPRIFDPKSRTIGIDKNALDLQVAEKREREKLERDRNSRFDSETLFFNSIRKRQEVEAQRQRRDLEKTTKDYGLTHLRKESRREWDLSDKEALRKKGFHTLDEENLGAASLMGLAGEDLSTQDRKAEQQRQMREWINQQKFEKQMLKKQEKEENDLWASQQEALCARLTAIKDEEARQRRMRAEQTADANRQMVGGSDSRMMGK
uniref:Uncharacterized protein n=1 Tax=Chromera velia CCMP2878 TaxID=1169474 RepID=A0A0G4GGY4_9ALVE|eukprot:Cvel_4693.t1-p1 / transcript=Cvel_4693.t1 / gene=Cvel_4693 / organism=Chromera_velia_CCMP2878 / gene_product=hypothetical protein / transcript_product=hypothetical protein / location=Cvel_scaffold208:91909-99114(-) / protein_length=256 / sequence_SO=supercontig / SO=protein_coding / is_pseudo=false